MCINIIKGVGALLPVIIILFIINVAVSMANGTPRTPNVEIAFAWIGTTGAMFHILCGFWRRFVASLLGSIVSLVAPYGINFWNSLAVSAGQPEYSPVMLFGLNGYFALLAIGQLAVAHLVARAVVRRRRNKRKYSPLAAA
jgi:hypothetical protein